MITHATRLTYLLLVALLQGNQVASGFWTSRPSRTTGPAARHSCTCASVCEPGFKNLVGTIPRKLERFARLPVLLDRLAAKAHFNSFHSNIYRVLFL